MTGDSDGDGEGDDEGVSVSSMNSLVNALGTIAREDDAAVGRFPIALIPEISETMCAGIVDQILKTRAAESESKGAEGVQTQTRLSAHPRAPKRRMYMLFVSGISVAAAAALALWVRAPSGEGAALPDYTIVAAGGVAETRGARPEGMEGTHETTTTSLVRLRADSEVRITCRPATTVVGAVAVRTFFVRPNLVEEVNVSATVAESGALELRLSRADLHGTGAARLRVAVGRPRAIRAIDPGEAASGAASTKFEGRRPGAGRQWLTVPLDLLD